MYDPEEARKLSACIIDYELERSRIFNADSWLLLVWRLS